MMKHLAMASALVALLLGPAACGGGSAAPPASEPESTKAAPAEAQPTEAGASADLTPDDLLAVLNPDDVSAALIQPESWWPLLPEINAGFEPAPEPISGERFWVTQSYQQVSALASGRVETTLILFEGDAEAQAGFAAMAALDGESRTAGEGPAAGDESRYFMHEASQEELDSGVLPYEALLRFRIGPLVGRISVFTELGYEQAATLASYFSAIESRAQALLAGELRAPELPATIAALLPSDPAPPAGPVFGSAVRPPESWAVVDSSGDPEAALEQLNASGVTELGLRRYGLEGEPDLVVEVTVYQMNDAASAADWVQGFVQVAEESGALDPGATGTTSAYTSYGGEFYELQFAAGPVVGDVACYAPFAATTAACEEAVRALAESWYQQLSAQ